MNKLFFTCFLLLVFGTSVLAADADLQKMEDALARGYLAAGRNDTRSALDHFSKSAAYAAKAKNWKGLVDTGNAFSALGKPRRSVSPLDKARRIALSRRDWRGLVAASYSYASLPESLAVKNKAVSALKAAFKIARDKKDWRGLLEATEALHKIEKKEMLEKYLAAAKKTVLSSGSGAAAAAFAELARKTGNMELYGEYSLMAKNFGYIRKGHTPPPPGWEPYGESVAGPGKISVEAQKTMRASADKEISSKMEYLAATKANDKEREKYKYYVMYRNYYDFPYYRGFYGSWHTLTPDQICGWADHHLSDYQLVDGVYVYAYEN